MKTPQITVVIPLYNNAPTIKRALDSILSQTVQDFEIIVVNDGSTDGGESIVKQIDDRRIRLINEDKQGVSLARNNGVAEAKSELIAFLDADDEWLPNFIETILVLRAKHPQAGLYGTGYKRISTNSEQTCLLDFNKEGNELAYFQEKLKHPLMIILTSGMAIPKSVFFEVGGFPVGYIQNEDRCLRAKIALNYPIIYCPKICAIYHVDGTNTIQRFTVKFLKDPFTEYVLENKSNLTCREDWNDIKEFCNVATLAMMSGNLKSAWDDKCCRNILKNMDTQTYNFEKNMYILTSHIPKNLRPVVVTMIQRCSAIKKLFLQ